MLGFPAALEQPVVLDNSCRSAVLALFVPSPHTFGGASKIFDAQASGDGQVGDSTLVFTGAQKLLLIEFHLCSKLNEPFTLIMMHFILI